jgi:integrase
MASIFTRKYKNGHRVYFRLKNSHGKWVKIKTEIYLDKLPQRNGKVLWPKHVIDLKTRIEAAQVLDQFGFKPTRRQQGVPISELLNRFLTESGKKRRDSTILQYKHAVDKFKLVHGDKNVREITYEDMYVFRDEMIRQVSKVSTAKYLRHLNGLFNWAADPERRLVDMNPISKNTKFVVKTKERPGFTDPQIRRVFRKALRAGDADFKNQLEFLLLTGFRSNESCMYRLDQFDFENKVIKHYNEKRDEYYPYPMDKRLERFLKRLPKTYAPYAFKYRSKHTVANYLKRIIRDLGYDDRLSTHSLKVTYVNRLKRAGLSPTTMHILSHHTSFQTTMIYIRRDVEHLREELEKSR